MIRWLPAAIRPAHIAWLAVPLACYFAVLQHLWANAPAWDDYGTVLETVLRMMDAPSAREWLGIVVAQHNEHRIAVLRLVSRGLAALGGIDFRMLILLGNLAFVGVFILIWAEFREGLPAPLLAAAGFLMFQWSYYEAAVWTSGALTNMGALFFAFSSLFLALRGGRMNVAASIVLAVLAVGSSANGLFPLPIAAAGCALRGQRRRAGVLAAAGLALWIAYFWGYNRPMNHPSPMAAVLSPLSTANLFLVVVGGVIPDRWGAAAAGAGILAVLAWLTKRGAWSNHPTAVLWIAFVLLTAAAAAVGRVGFGVHYASRYAIYSSCLLVLAFLGFYQLTRPWTPRTLLIAVAGAAVASLALSLASWRDARKFALDAHLLARVVLPSAHTSTRPYFGMYYPYPDLAAAALDAAEKRGLYAAPRRAIYPGEVRVVPTLPATSRIAGHIDEITVAESRVTVVGWTDIPATVPRRTFSVYSPGSEPRAMAVRVTDRMNAARAMQDARLVFAGYRLELDYPTPQDAATAAASLCIGVEAPGHAAAVLSRTTARCPAQPALPASTPAVPR